MFSCVIQESLFSPWCVFCLWFQSFEALNQRAVAVVVDPIQSVKGKVVIDAFRLINPQTMMLGQEPRQTTSNLGHLNKPSIQVATAILPEVFWFCYHFFVLWWIFHTRSRSIWHILLFWLSCWSLLMKSLLSPGIHVQSLLLLNISRKITRLKRMSFLDC